VIAKDRFRKSSFLSISRCVGVRRLPDGEVALRDTKNPALSAPHFTPVELDVFTTGEPNLQPVALREAVHA
jgi:hypothetical protein